MRREFLSSVLRRLAAAVLVASAPAGLAACLHAYPAQGQEGAAITFGTFNIHYTFAGERRMIWKRRRNAVVAALRDGNADIIAFQEMETFAGGHWNVENRQLDWVASHFPEFAVTCVGDPRLYPSTQPVLYRSDRFQALDQGWFFFSAQPDRIYSRPWKGRFPAFCSWSRLLDSRTGRSFYLYNVHFDYSSAANRRGSARLVMERVLGRSHPEEPVVVLGDFNAPRFFPAVTVLREAGLKVAPTLGSTFHFYLGLNVQPAIDHVLFSSGFSYGASLVLRRRYGGIWPSDHYPVFVTLLPRRRPPGR